MEETNHRRTGYWARHALCCALALLAAPLAAQEFPTRPISLVVPYPAGGDTDVVARYIADGIARRVGQTVTVENRAGATGAIGTTAVARARPDGHTLLLGTNAQFNMLPHLRKDLQFNAARDFVPVGILVQSAPMWLCAHPSFAPRTLREAVEYIKANPGKVNYGSSGVGGLSHIAGQQMNHDLGLTIVHVPYKGNAPRLQAILGGEIQLAFFNLPAPLEYEKSGRLKCYGALGRERTPPNPNMPTFAELGYPNFIYDVWYSVFAPAGTPAVAVSRLDGALQEVARDPAVQAKFAELGLIKVVGMSPPQLQDLIARESERWRLVFSGIRIEGE